MGTDSFDSTLGTWNSQATNSDALGWYAASTGHVGSNADIDIYSSVIIRGDARSGPSESTSIHGGSAQVYGSTDSTDAAIELPTPPLEGFQAALVANNNGEIVSSADITYDDFRKNLRVDGSDTLVLSGGVYFFNDLEINSSSKLVVQARTVIYVTGDLLLTSSVAANFPGKAADLTIIAHPYDLTPGWSAPTDPIELNSSLNASLTIYAPYRDVYMDSSVHLYGALVGQYVEVNGSVSAHYDRALAGDGTESTTSQRLYWLEPRPPTR